MTVDVPQEFESFVASLVARRRFLSEHEVMVESLRLLQARESLAEEIQKGFEQIDGGQSGDGPVAFAKLRSLLEERLRASYGRLERVRVFEIKPPFGDEAPHFINILRRSCYGTKQPTEIAYEQFPVSNV